MYQAKSGVKKFSLYWEGGFPRQKFFSQSEHVSSQIWCQKFFPLLGGRGSLDKKFFPQSEHVSSQIWCQKNFPLLGGVPLTKNFFPSLNMYQAKSGVKKFSLYWGGGPLNKKFFFWSEHVSSQIWCQKFFPLLRPGTPLPHLDLDLGPPLTWTWDPPQTWDWVPPQIWDQVPPHLDLDLGPPPTWTWTWDPHLGVDWQTENSTFPHPSDAGGNYSSPKSVLTWNILSQFIVKKNLVCKQKTALRGLVISRIVQIDILLAACPQCSTILFKWKSISFEKPCRLINSFRFTECREIGWD